MRCVSFCLLSCSLGLSFAAHTLEGTCTIGRGRAPVIEIEGETGWRYEGATNNMYQTEHDELFA